MRPPPSHDRDRIPSLDGLRAVSIAFVFLGHLAGTRGFPLGTAAGNASNIAELGVHVFFVISGYLITRLLLEEVARHGHIELPRFYLRRTLRIFPPYYALLAVLAIADVAGLVALHDHDVLHAMTYTSNYDRHRSWYVGHTWSLSVEEQFYLLWPAVMLLLRPRKAIIAAAAVVLLVPVIRVASWELMRWTGDGIGHRFETVADAIAIGCVLAGVRARLHRSPLYLRMLSSPAFLLVPLLTFAANLLGDHPVVYFGAAFTLVNLGVALCVDWCVTFADGRIGRVLNAQPLVFVGWLSYSLYLWQQLFLNRASGAWTASFPLNLTLAVVAALGSYYAIERPSLALRRRIERRFPRPIAANRPVAALVPAGPGA
jgi:peptidoglycan/LPS O-acetylase OafA/YrhL